MDFDISTMNMGQIANLGAWGLGLGSLFFGFVGIRADKDFFLMLGLICCIFGDIGFTFFLMDQEGETNNETMITIFVLLTLMCFYAGWVQWWKFRTEGCGDDEDVDGGEDTSPAPPLARGGSNASSTAVVPSSSSSSASTAAAAESGSKGAGATKRK